MLTYPRPYSISRSLYGRFFRQLLQFSPLLASGTLTARVFEFFMMKYTAGTGGRYPLLPAILWILASGVVILLMIWYSRHFLINLSR